MSFLEVPFCVWTTSNLAVGISLRSQGIVAVVIFVARMGSTVAATTMCGTAMFARHYRRRQNKRRGKNDGKGYALHGLRHTGAAIAFQIAPRAMMPLSGTLEYRCATRSARCIRTCLLYTSDAADE